MMKKIILALMMWPAMANADTVTNRFGFVLPTVGSFNWGPKISTNFVVADNLLAGQFVPNTYASSQTINNSMQVNSLRVNLASDDGSGSSLQVGGTGGIDMNNANSKLTIFANNAIQSNNGNTLALGLTGWTSMSITPPLTMLSSVTINGNMRFNGRFDLAATFGSSVTVGSNGGAGSVFALNSGGTDIFISSAGSGGGGNRYYSDAAGSWLWFMEGSANTHGKGYMSLFKNPNYSIVVEPTNGYVSIGNATATNPLHVQGNADVSGKLGVGLTNPSTPGHFYGNAVSTPIVTIQDSVSSSGNDPGMLALKDSNNLYGADFGLDASLGDLVIRRIVNGVNTETMRIARSNGNITFAAGTIGVTDGSSACVGCVGEVLSANGVSSPLPATNTGVAIATLTVTAGAYDLTGKGAFATGATSAGSEIRYCISTSNTSCDTSSAGGFTDMGYNFVASDNYYLPLSPRSVSVSGSTVYYLVCRPTYTVAGGASCYGPDSYIQARRMR